MICNSSSFIEFPYPKKARKKYLRPEVASLLQSYRQTWKSRQNHFLRRSDVKVKEEKRPTVNELANETRIEQKVSQRYSLIIYN